MSTSKTINRIQKMHEPHTIVEGIRMSRHNFMQTRFKEPEIVILSANKWWEMVNDSKSYPALQFSSQTNRATIDRMRIIKSEDLEDNESHMY